MMIQEIQEGAEAACVQLSHPLQAPAPTITWHSSADVWLGWAGLGWAGLAGLGWAGCCPAQTGSTAAGGDGQTVARSLPLAGVII